MTTINLMPPVLLEKKKGQWRNILLGLGLSIIVVVLAVWYGSIVLDVKRKEKKLAEITAKIAELQPYLTEIRRLETEILEMKKRLDIITQLDKDRFIWANLLDNLSQCLPNGVWLTRFANSQENQLIMDGQAFDNFAIANLMINLMNSKFFANVELSRITNGDVGGCPVKVFNIGCSFRSGV